jgi:GMP synthase (glutamine-hydrolysing)
MPSPGLGIYPCRVTRRSTRVLVLATGEAIDAVRRAHGGFEALFAAGLAHAEVVYVDVTARAADAPLPDTQGIDGVLMTGSAAMVDEDAPWMRYGTRAIRAFVDEGVPFLGVCFGHQLLGAAMGADVGPNPRGRAMGSARLEVHTPDPLFHGMPPGFYAQVAHRDVIRDPGPNLEVLGRADHDDCHVVRAGERAWGVQFHPEFDHRVSELYVHARASILDEEREGASEAALRSLRETPNATRVLARFASLCEETR